MKLPRLFLPLDKINSTAQREIELDEQQLHYLRRVLRLPVGSKLYVFDGLGQQFMGQLVGEDKIKIAEPVSAINLSPLIHIVLYPALLKSDKMEWVIQKAVEIGVDQIVPVQCNRSIGMASPSKIERWQRIATSAAAQCGSNYIPHIRSPLSWAQAIKSHVGPQIVLWEEKKSHPLITALPAHPTSALGLFIGPEGGFTPEEVDLAASATICGLGQNILRAETASIVALANIHFAYREIIFKESPEILL